MTKLTKCITNALGIFLSFLMATMVLDVTWQVFTRFILRNPSSYTEELARFQLMWVGVLGASYAYRTKAHLGIDVLATKLTGTKRRILEVAINLSVLFFALFVMVVGGVRLVQLTFTLGQVSTALGVPMGYVYSVLPISGFLMIYFALHFIVEALREERAPAVDSQVGEPT
ncbi:MAG: TRAP transporter small permease [bacterium]|jgi:TRAP-type C4-dicarboxylate transport system permease small subunit|nr:TRAP transporter small permease [candidate division KSB1 bacterium]MDH7558644.1 TRAP transporter small permease [bacterium]